MRPDRRPLLRHVAVALAMMLAAVACSLPTDDEAAIIPPEDLPDALARTSPPRQPLIPVRAANRSSSTCSPLPVIAMSSCR